MARVLRRKILYKTSVEEKKGTGYFLRNGAGMKK